MLLERFLDLSYSNYCFIVFFLTICISTVEANSFTTATPLTGKYAGTYTCGQGLTGLALTLTGEESGKVTALFEFYPVEENPDVPFGSWEMIGALSASGYIVLSATKWIDKPKGYITVDLAGVVTIDLQEISGEVTHDSCTTFKVLKQSDDFSASVPPLNDFVGTWVNYENDTPARELYFNSKGDFVHKDLLIGKSFEGSYYKFVKPTTIKMVSFSSGGTEVNLGYNDYGDLDIATSPGFLFTDINFADLSPDKKTLTFKDRVFIKLEQ